MMLNHSDRSEQEPRQLRNNRKKPKKFSDGDSPTSSTPVVKDGKEPAVAAAAAGVEGGFGKAVEARKTSASRELSRLGDEAVLGEQRWSSVVRVVVLMDPWSLWSRGPRGPVVEIVLGRKANALQKHCGRTDGRTLSLIESLHRD